MVHDEFLIKFANVWNDSPLFFSGVSDCPFGVRSSLRLMHKKKTLLSFKPDFKNPSSKTCQPIQKRGESRFIYWEIPDDFSATDHLLNVEARFCNHRFKAMPKSILSKPFKIKI